VLPADARFRSAKALVLRALRIVTRDQGVFNSAIHEALRSALGEIESALAREQEARLGLRDEVGALRTEAERRIAEARGALLSALDTREAALEAIVAGMIEREAVARDAIGREVEGSQRRLDILETRSDEMRSRLATEVSRLGDSAARLLTTEEGLEKLRLDLGRTAEDVRAYRLEWTTLRTELRPGTGSAQGAEAGPETRSAADPISAGLYADFEREFRGAEDDIRARQEGDVSLFLGVRGPVADLGCGRGEFLEALTARGLEARGCDTNPVMVARCREKGLAVEEADLVSWLRARPEGSLGGITAYQVVEHLPADALLPLVELAVTRLAPGGRLLLETVNAESVYAMKWFWMDLTHVRPVPAPSLGRLMEACGLRDVSTAYRSPVPREVTGGNVEAADPLVAAMAKLLFAPQDVAVTGVR
jgi:O-antigen chain-terminating methyltransferase